MKLIRDVDFLGPLITLLVMGEIDDERRRFLKTTATIVSATTAVGLSARAASDGPVVPLKLKDKVALITGGAQGIGLACALQFLNDGASVVINDISDKIPAALEKMKAIDARRTDGVKADVRNLSEMQSAVDRTLSKFGKIDIVVANAGTSAKGPFWELTPEHWKSVIETNLTGVANSFWPVVHHMKNRQQGRLIAMSSVLGRMGGLGVASYAPSKWGVIGLVKCLALELGPFNITVNGVAPTLVSGTDLAEKMYAAHVSMASFHALNVPAVTPEDVAKVTSFLASDDARYISGAVVDVTAGGGAHYTA